MANKYVIDKYNNVVVWNGDSTSHSDIAHAMFGEPVSAGFCHINGDRVDTYGESVSLGIESHKNDYSIIQDKLNLD